MVELDSGQSRPSIESFETGFTILFSEMHFPGHTLPCPIPKDVVFPRRFPSLFTHNREPTSPSSDFTSTSNFPSQSQSSPTISFSNGNLEGRSEICRILLTSIDTLVQVQKCLLSHRQATFDDSLFSLKLSFCEPLYNLFPRGRELRCVIEDDEALHLDSHGDDHREILT